MRRSASVATARSALADELADGQHADRPSPVRLAGVETDADLAVGHLAGLALRVADGRRPVAEQEGVVEHDRCSSWADDGANTVMPGTS